MLLTSLLATAGLSIDYDCRQDCLFLTLHSQFEPMALRDIMLGKESFRIAEHYPAWCLVLDNTVLAGTAAVDWLVDQLLPSFHRAGVRHWTWVCNSTLRSQLLAEQVAQRLPQIKLTVFSDLEHAATWLQHTS